MNLAAMGDGSTAIAVPLKCAATKRNAPWLTPMSNRQHCRVAISQRVAEFFARLGIGQLAQREYLIDPGMQMRVPAGSPIIRAYTPARCAVRSRDNPCFND
jgi:hypothetical protein